MTLSVDALLVVSLMMAVFAAVSTVGTSLYLGAGFERLRAGFEAIKKQTAFFSDHIHKLDTRVESVEKQSGYFFEAITNLEQRETESAASQPEMDETPAVAKEKLIRASKDDSLNMDLLTASGFIGQPARQSLSEQFGCEANRPEQRPYFH